MLACFMCCELPFYLSDAECPPFSDSCIDLLTYAKQTGRQGTKQSAGTGEIFFCSPIMGIEQFEGTLEKTKRLRRIVLYAYKTHGLTCTPLHTNLSVNVCLWAREDA